MPIYSKSSAAMVFDAINLANPDLPKKADATYVKLGTPTSQTPPTGTSLNTKLAVTATAEGTYVGKNTVEYERLDLSIILRGVKVEIPLWNPNNPGSLYNPGYALSQLLPHLNRKYGLSLTMDDLTEIRFDYSQPNSASTMNEVVTKTVTAKSTSLGFIGSFSMTWKNAPRTLEAAIPVNELDIRALPGGNDFSGGHKEIINFMGFLTDWSDMAKAKPWQGYPDSYTPAYANTLQAFVTAYYAELNTRYGTNLPTPTIPDASGKSFADVRVVSLPHADYPEANSRFYNRLLLLTVSDTNPNTVGTHYVHYNV